MHRDPRDLGSLISTVSWDTGDFGSRLCDFNCDPVDTGSSYFVLSDPVDLTS